ncbi:hypothetical protein B0H13DRAFT_1472942, partial [Mycena leptocephala]
RSYQLSVVQQPQETAEFVDANLSCLPLTPPTVVQLTATDSNGNLIVPYEYPPVHPIYLHLAT